MLTRVSDPDQPMARSEWTIRQCAAHVVASLGDYGDSLSGLRPLRQVDPNVGPTNAQIRAVNAVRMSAVEHLDLGQLSSMINQQIDSFLESTSQMPGETVYDWYGKQSSTLASMMGIMLGEVLLHGFDMARSARLPWRIGRDEATLVLLGAFVLLPAYVDQTAARGVRRTYRMRLRGGPEIGVIFDDGAAVVTAPVDHDFDCVVSADPTALLLISYGRAGVFRFAITGRVVAWGRKPWHALSFAKLIMNP